MANSTGKSDGISDGKSDGNSESKSNKNSAEKDLMLAGKLYLASDPQLTAERLKAKQLCRAFNTALVEAKEERDTILTKLLGGYSPWICIEPPFFCDYGYNIYVGKNFYMNHDGIILDVNRVSIGDDVQIGPKVQILSASHPLNPEERLKGRELGLPITIGNNVWIGGGVMICPGVTIGDDTTIGAGSVVTRDIPSRVFAAGNPCRVIRKL